MKTIDLRSDTLTQPTGAMREAMAHAVVGDDVYGEDPTVNQLQEMAAARIGKEAALFVPSGTMANQIALRALTRPGDVVLASADAHILVYESGAPAALSGLQIQTLGEGGRFTGADVSANIAPRDSHFAPTRVVALENTHNRAGGLVLPIAQAQDIAGAAREAGLSIHLDGARLFNAEVASGTPAREWAALCDTVSFCFSKGLGAPVGSVVCSSAERIDELHRARKLFGGGMRQAGILAAAGIYALTHHVDRLADDHANARRLADGLTRQGYNVPTAPETNIVAFEVADTQAFIRTTRARNLHINPIRDGLFRAVTHLDISEGDIDEALERIGTAD